MYIQSEACCQMHSQIYIRHGLHFAKKDLGTSGLASVPSALILICTGACNRGLRSMSDKGNLDGM